MEKLLKEKNAYDESEIQDIIKKYPGRSARRNALYNLGLKKDIFDEHKINLITIYCAFHEHLNLYNDLEKDIDDLQKKTKSLEDDALEKLSDLARFYYSQCKNPGFSGMLDPSFKLIIMSSMIESLMSSEEFLEFEAWYFKECSSETKKNAEQRNFNNAIKLLWQKYKSRHGAYRKFKKFFESFLSKDEQQKLLNGFSSVDDEAMKIDVDQVAKWLYQMRSNFVHNAEHVNLAEQNPYYDDQFVADIVGGDSIITSINIDSILSIFEKGFLRYFGLKNK